MLIDKAGTGRSISRYKAADIKAFTEAIEHGFIKDTDGDIQYALTINIDGNYHGAQFCWPGEKVYSQDRLSQGIVEFYGALATDGIIGHLNLDLKPAALVTGNPFNDLVQVGLELTDPNKVVGEA